MTYEARGLNLVVREIAAFFRGVVGNTFTTESLTVFLPLLILWEALPRLGVVPAALAPPLSRVAVAFADLAANHDLAGHVAVSMLRFALGFGLAVALAVPLGTLMGWNQFLRRHGLPLFQILAPIPPPAWVPIVIILLGIGLPMQVFLVFLGAFYPVLFNTYQGVKDTDPRHIASARAFGASEFTLITRVYLPHALGFVVMGWKLGNALGLVMLVVAEMVGAHSGLGWLLIESNDFFRIDRMVVAMLVLGFIGWFLIEIMKYVETKLAVWKVGR
jgi:ABC-type nitrate/sulfonate/bicarbonate transport system permease component